MGAILCPKVRFGLVGGDEGKRHQETTERKKTLILHLFACVWWNVMFQSLLCWGLHEYMIQ